MGVGFTTGISHMDRSSTNQIETLGVVMRIPKYQTPELRNKNVRLAWVLGGMAIFFLVTSFPFWTGLFRIVGTQAMP